jgi:uncharacterized membrane protein AbrB (regulator of aidB expression)
MTEHEDYAHIRDPQSERTKWELWAIVAIVVVVIAGSMVWRAVTYHPGRPQTDGNHNTAASSAIPGGPSASLPAAAADTLPH